MSEMTEGAPLTNTSTSPEPQTPEGNENNRNAKNTNNNKNSRGTSKLNSQNSKIKLFFIYFFFVCVFCCTLAFLSFLLRKFACMFFFYICCPKTNIQRKYRLICRTSFWGLGMQI